MLKTIQKRNEIAIFYDLFHKTSSLQTKTINHDNFTYKYAIKMLEFILKRRKNVRVLDYGCGVGTLDFFIAKMWKCDVLGIDVSREAMFLASKSAELMGISSVCKFQTVELWNKVNVDDKYDLVICIEVLEHIPNDSKTLSVLFSCLKSGGILLLSTPSINAPLYRLGLTQKFDAEVGHVRRYDSSCLAKKLEKTGFVITKTNKVEGIIRNSLFVFRPLGIFGKFVRGLVSSIITFFDEFTVLAFGESNIYFLARKP